MGFFNKKVSNSDKNQAANAFAGKEKQVSTASDDGTADRILGYNKLKGAESLHEVPGDRVEELRRIREAQRQHGNDDEQRRAAEDRAKAAAGDAISARKNLLNSDGITRRTELSAEERASIERQGMSALGGVTEVYQNKKLLTEIEGLGDTDHSANLDAYEIDGKTAIFRNAGFITETEAEYSRPLTAEEKLKQELDELESAETAISSFTNVGFRHQSAPSHLIEEEEDK